MLKNIYSILFLLLFLVNRTEAATVEGVNEEKCKHYLSACAIFQDEGPYLKEWIEFHRLMGVEHFYLYNDRSTDNYYSILKPYINSGIVDLIDWPIPDTENWIAYQKQAYNHCISKCCGKTRWLAVLDIDEFMFPVDKKDLVQFLKPYDLDKRIGGIMLFWQVYGTSNISKIPDGELMIEHLIKKAVKDHPWNRHVKTICKPHKVSKFEVHGAHYKKGYWDITTNGSGGPNQPIQINRARVNHYWTRDEHFFYQVKVPRKERLTGSLMSEDTINSLLFHFNQEEDKAIFPFIPKLKKRMNKK